VRYCILSHLPSLKFRFGNYFSGRDIENFDWVRNLFNAEVMDGTLTMIEEEEEIIDITDTALKIKFSALCLSEFWVSVQNEYRELSEKAVNILILFATSYLHESGFSVVAAIKRKVSIRS
jgi:hypothetical protein